MQWLTSEGLRANVIRDGRPSLVVEPMESAGGETLHRVSIQSEVAGHDHGHQDHDEEQGEQVQATSQQASAFSLAGAAVSSLSSPLPSEDVSVGSAGEFTTLAPSRVIQVREFEVGVEIGSNALLNNYSGATTQDKVDHAMLEAQMIPGNLDARYLHGAGVKHRLGTVIIRTGTDPFTVSNGNDSGGLAAFRDYWNNLQANEGIAPTHDLAVYHVRASPSGLAYVNTVGTSKSLCFVCQ